jgi:hypothetical protein
LCADLVRRRPADGTKTTLDKLQARKRTTETRIELKRRLLAHNLQQIGLKTLRTPTATLSITEASLKAIASPPSTSTEAAAVSHHCCSPPKASRGASKPVSVKLINRSSSRRVLG